MVRKMIGSLGSLLADAQEQGLAARNAVRDLRRNRRRGKDCNAERRQKGKLKIGVDIPTPDEIKAIIANAKGRWRPLLITADLHRASRLRAARAPMEGRRPQGERASRPAARRQVQRDRQAQVGRWRARVPFGKFVANTLKEWKLACPKSDGDLVFPNGAGKVEMLGQHHQPWPDPRAAPRQAKYTGLHSLRHFYASWCINRPADGGLGLAAEDRAGAAWSFLDHNDL